MKKLRLKVTRGSLPTSPVLVEVNEVVPDALPNYAFSYKFEKKIWFVPVVFLIEFSIGPA